MSDAFPFRDAKRFRLKAGLRTGTPNHELGASGTVGLYNVFDARFTPDQFVRAVNQQPGGRRDGRFHGFARGVEAVHVGVASFPDLLFRDFVGDHARAVAWRAGAGETRSFDTGGDAEGDAGGYNESAP